MNVPRQLRCVMAQLNLVVGDVDGNTSRIIAAANEARDRYRADLVMLPELAVSGYPPEDLLFHSGMRLQVAGSLERLKQEVRGITLIAGYPEYSEARIFNSAIVIRDGDGARQSSQGVSAELPGIRRKALFHAGHGADHHRAQRHEGGSLGMRGCLGFGAGAPGARAGRAGAADHQCLALRGRQAEQREQQVVRRADRRNSAYRWCSAT